MNDKGLLTDAIGRGGLVTCFGVFCASIVVLISSLGDQRANLNALFNSDTLFPTRVHDDLTRDHYPMAGWQFPVAPFWFPDQVGYSCLRVLIGHTTGAVIVYGIAQFVSITLAFAWVAIALCPNRWKTSLAISLLSGAGAATLTAAGRWHTDDWAILFELQLHSGTFSVMALVLGNAIFSLRSQRVVRQFCWSGATVVVLAPTIASDRIIILWCVIPLVLALVTARILSARSKLPLGVPNVSLWFLLVAMSLALVVGETLYRTYHGGLDHPAQQDYQRLDSEALKRGLIALLYHLVDGSQSSWLTVSAVFGTVLATFTTVKLLRRFVIEPYPQSPTHGEFLAVWFVYTVVLSLGVVAGLGVIDRVGNPWPWAIKYLHPVFFGPWFGLACVLVHVNGVVIRAVIRLGILSLCIGLVTLALRPIEHPQSYWHYYPSDVRELDELAEQYGLEYGLASFWEAHYTTVLSRRKLKVFGVEPSKENTWGFTVFHWLSNRYWYTGFPPHHSEPRYTFVLLGTRYAPDVNRVLEGFGPPVLRRRIGANELLIYSEPNSLLASAIRFDRRFITTHADLRKAREPIVYPGRTLHHGDCGLDTLQGDRKVAAPSKAGHLALSPRWPATPGQYELRITYTAREAIGSGWHLFEHHSSMGGNFNFLWMNWLADGTRQTDTAIVTIPDRGIGTYDLSARILYGGRGELTIHQLEVRRLETKR